MTIVTQADYARLKGWNRSTVSRAMKAGRLVGTDDGRIDVEASDARYAGTADPGRDDVAQRHADQREKVAVGTQSAGAGATASAAPAAPADDRVGNSYQAARAVKEKYAALSAKAEYERTIGQLLPRADVEMALDDLVSFARSNLENLPHRLAAQVIGKDYDATLALLKQEVVAMMAEMHKDARQKLAALTAGEGAGA